MLRAAAHTDNGAVRDDAARGSAAPNSAAPATSKGKAAPETAAPKRPARRPASGHPGGPPGGGPVDPSERARDAKGTVRRLARLLAPELPRIVAVLLLCIAATLFDVFAPAQLGRATTTVFEGAQAIAAGTEGAHVDFDALRTILAIVVALYLAQGLFTYLQTFVMARVTQNVVYGLRRQVDEKINRIPLSYFDARSKGDILSRVVNDVDLVSSTLQDSLTQLVGGVVTLVGVVAMMLMISPLMSIVAFVSLPLSVFATVFVARRNQKLYLAQQTALGTLDGHIEETYGGHVEVRAFTHEQQAVAEFERVNAEYFGHAWRAQFVSGIIRPLTQFIGNASYVVVCVLGAAQVLAGAIAVGDIQAFTQYMRSFTRPIAQIASIVNTLQATLAGAERVFELLDAPEMDAESMADVRGAADADADGETDARGADETAGETGAAYADGAAQAADETDAQGETVAHAGTLAATDTALAASTTPAASTQSAVSFIHVRFGYDPATPVIRDFSVEVPRGSQVAIVGPTGAGKSTLVNLLMRFYEIDGGAILLNGRDIREMGYHELRSHFGMVLQETWLFNGTIAENIAYSKDGATREEVEAAARAAHVDRFIRTLPDGYETVVNEEASNISTGERQLITIARALLADPEILIFDEATSNIDSRTERQVQDAFSRLAAGRTSFVIAHRLSTIRAADTILVIDGGDIVEQGTHEGLLAKGGFYADLYNSQFAECIDELNE